MVAMAKKAWFALMNWKTRTGSPRSPVRTRPLPLPGYRAPGAVAGSHAADGSAPRARRWSGRPVGGLHRDQPDEPSSRSPGRSVRTRATAPPVFAQIGPEQPSVAGIPAHRVGDSSASMTPPSQMERCPPNRVNSRAWGWNGIGQLGDATTIDRHTPVQVQNLSGVTAVDAGQGHNLALKSDGTVWGWGLNCSGELGDGTTIDRHTPVQVQNLSGVRCVASGDDHSLALKSDGTVWTWGRNMFGELGDGTITDRHTSVQGQNLGGITAVAAGAGH